MRDGCSRRDFLIFLALVSGCTTGPHRRIVTSYEALPSEFIFNVSKKNQGAMFEGCSMRVDHKKVRKIEEEFLRNREIDFKKATEPLLNIIDNPFYMLYYPFNPLLLFDSIDREIRSYSNPKIESNIFKDGKFDILSTKIAKEIISTQELPEIDRIINIVIESKNNNFFITAKTNKKGVFKFNFEKFLLETGFKKNDYSISFFHREKEFPIRYHITEKEIISINLKNIKMKNLKHTNFDKKYFNKVNSWFILIDIASTVKSSHELAKNIYLLYKRYRWSIIFVRRVAFTLFPKALAYFLIEEAIIYFAKSLFLKYDFQFS